MTCIARQSQSSKTPHRLWWNGALMLRQRDRNSNKTLQCKKKKRWQNFRLAPFGSMLTAKQSMGSSGKKRTHIKNSSRALAKKDKELVAAAKALKVEEDTARSKLNAVQKDWQNKDLVLHKRIDGTLKSCFSNDDCQCPLLVQMCAKKRDRERQTNNSAEIDKIHGLSMVVVSVRKFNKS